MKKFISTIILLISILMSNAQDSTVVNIVATKMNKIEFIVLINKVKVGTIKKGKNLQVKMISSGEVNIEYISGTYREDVTLYLDSGEEYFLEVNSWNDRYYSMSETKGREAFESNELTEVFNEDLNNLIGVVDKKTLSFIPSQGSGFLVNKEGYILTNFHVVNGAETIEILGIKGDFTVPFKAKLIAADIQSDLALLKIESKIIQFNNPPYTLLSSDSIIKAESVFAMGFPMENLMGSEVKVTDGIINSLTGVKQSISQIQISAAIQGGNSGGPLFNSRGELIGIVSAKIRSDVADQVGYAIKSNYVKFFLEESGVTEFSDTKNQLVGKSLAEQVSLISNFVYLIKTK